MAPRKAFHRHAFEIRLAFWHWLWVTHDRNPGQEQLLILEFDCFVMRSRCPFLFVRLSASVPRFCRDGNAPDMNVSVALIRDRPRFLINCRWERFRMLFARRPINTLWSADWDMRTMLASAGWEICAYSYYRLGLYWINIFKIWLYFLILFG